VIFDDGLTVVASQALTLTDSTSGYVNLFAGYKVQGSTPDTSITVTNMPSGVLDYHYAVFVLRGADTTTPMDATATTNTVTNGMNITPADITVATDGAYALVCAASGNAETGAYSSSDSFDVFESVTNGNRLTTAVGGFSIDSGAFSPAAFVHGGGSSSFACAVSVTIAVRPA